MGKTVQASVTSVKEETRAIGGQTTDNGTGHEVGLKAGVTFHPAGLRVPSTRTGRWARCRALGFPAGPGFSWYGGRADALDSTSDVGESDAS
jgi:hypothetical protein